MDEDNSYEYKLQNPIYQTDAFIMQLTKSMLENQKQIAKLEAEKAILEAQRQSLAYGYVGQFPVQDLQFHNGYYMPRAAFNDNWNAYWNGVVRAQNIQNQQSVQREIAKVGLEIIGEQAKQNNNHVLAIATNAIGVVQADNLAEAISDLKIESRNKMKDYQKDSFEILQKDKIRLEKEIEVLIEQKMRETIANPTMKEFIELVREMRNAQKEYFKKYLLDKRSIFIIGVNFDAVKGNLIDWKEEKIAN